MTKWLLFLLVGLVFSFDYVPCEQKNTLNSIVPNGNVNYGKDLAYDPARNEYFVVYIQEESPGQTSVMGRTLSELGNPTGEPIHIFLYKDGTGRKANPVLSFNSVRQIFLIAFEYDYSGNGTDFDIMGVTIGAHGQVLESSLRFLAGSEYRETSPSLTYNHDDDQFLFTYERIRPIPNGNSTNQIVDIAVARLNGTGFMLPGSIYFGSDGGNEGKPHVAYNHHKKEYFLVVETPDANDKGQRDLVGFFVNRVGSVNLTGTYLSARDYFNTTHLSHHSPKILYSPVNQTFFLTFQVDLEGTEALSDIVSVIIDADSGLPLIFHVMSIEDSLTSNRRHDIIYSIHTNSFLVVFETFKETLWETVGMVLHSNLTKERLVEWDNNPKNTFAPLVEYNWKNKEYLVIYNIQSSQDSNSGIITLSLCSSPRESIPSGLSTGVIVAIILSTVSAALLLLGGIIYVAVIRRRSTSNFLPVPSEEQEEGL